MKKWRTRDMPPADPEERAEQAMPRRAPARSQESQAEPTSSRTTGFKAAWEALKNRKLAELASTLKWRRKSVTEADREAEAKKRADREMARRIRRQTGKEPAQSTIRRNVAKDSSPRGVDQERLDRQAAIDRAGGVKEFAAQAQVSESTARRWLARQAVIFAPIAATGPILIYFTVKADLFHTSTDPKKGRKAPTPQYGKILKTTGRGSGWTGVSALQLSGEEAADFLQLLADGDQQALRDKLGELLENYELNGEESEWGSAYTRCEVTDIIEIAVSE